MPIDIFELERTADNAAQLASLAHALSLANTDAAIEGALIMLSDGALAHKHELRELLQSAQGQKEAAGGTAIPTSGTEKTL